MEKEKKRETRMQFQNRTTTTITTGMDVRPDKLTSSFFFLAGSESNTDFVKRKRDSL